MVFLFGTVCAKEKANKKSPISEFRALRSAPWGVALRTYALFEKVRQKFSLLGAVCRVIIKKDDRD